ncbi:putative toxin [Microbacterium sp. P04]|uniref:putative toxin n=1 Tax=Microbacterium sp. P04 TaxID=3366947 RepID=UPI003744D40D
MGQAGEALVSSTYTIGEKAARQVVYPVTGATRSRIFDGLTSDALAEVKNVKSLSLTQQLRGSLTYSQKQSTPIRFDLYVRGNPSPTKLSGPLCDKVRSGEIVLKLIPQAPNVPSTGLPLCPS